MFKTSDLTSLGLGVSSPAKWGCEEVSKKNRVWCWGRHTSDEQQLPTATPMPDPPAQAEAAMSAKTAASIQGTEMFADANVQAAWAVGNRPPSRGAFCASLRRREEGDRRGHREKGLEAGEKAVRAAGRNGGSTTGVGEGGRPMYTASFPKQRPPAQPVGTGGTATFRWAQSRDGEEQC